MPGYFELIMLVFLLLFCAYRALVVCRRWSYRRRLAAFYAQHNPDKIRDVDKVLARYVGQEPLLFDDLERKYNGAGGNEPAATSPANPNCSPMSGAGQCAGGDGGRVQRRVL
jgi:hypothetical protein